MKGDEKCPGSFTIKRANFEFLVSVNTVRMARNGRSVSPFVAVKLVDYNTDNYSVYKTLFPYFNKLQAKAKLHPEDKVFSLAFGLHKALDRITREICGILKVAARSVCKSIDAGTSALAQTNATSKRKFIKRHKDHEDMKELLPLVNVEAVETTKLFEKLTRQE